MVATVGASSIEMVPGRDDGGGSTDSPDGVVSSWIVCYLSLAS